MTQTLATRAKELKLSERVHLMGVLNVTPDSFSDGGKYIQPEAAIARAEQMAEEGADIFDVGGESSRPGAQPVSAEEEARRVVPIVEILAQRFPRIPVSVDTTKAEVARRCLEEGASIINDISAFRFDPHMIEVVRQHEVPAVLMHMQGDPRTMQKDPAYKDVVAEISAFFKERIEFSVSRGLKKDRILLDPGIGFGKKLEHNLQVLAGLGTFVNLGLPLVVGTSRKSFIGHILEDEGRPSRPEDRLEGTIASCLWAASNGARILRVHDVKAVARALKVWETIESVGGG